jgi:CRISPR-associated endonuclease Csn1
MKKILGLDLGTTSIGWALVDEAENSKEKSEIKKLGVRAIQYDSFSKVEKNGKVTESKSPKDDFNNGNGLSSSASRTQKRAARRNLQRFKLRRKKLIEVLTKNYIISTDSILEINIDLFYKCD